jgi:hypothetical protein
LKRYLGEIGNTGHFYAFRSDILASAASVFYQIIAEPSPLGRLDAASPLRQALTTLRAIFFARRQEADQIARHNNWQVTRGGAPEPCTQGFFFRTERK